MDTNGRARTRAGDDRRSFLRQPIVLSTLVHTVAVTVAIAALAGSTTRARSTLIGSLELRPVERQVTRLADAVDLPDVELEVSEETWVADLPSLETPCELPEACEEDVALLPPVAGPCLDLPLSAARRPPPAPARDPAPIRISSVPAPRPPPVRRPVVRQPAVRRPAVAAAPRAAAPRARLRVTWAPDVRPYYPRAALRAGIGGQALVRLVIDARGRVVDARLERSSGRRDLDAAALRLARAYRFSIGTGNRTTRLPVTFQPPRRGRAS